MRSVDALSKRIHKDQGEHACEWDEKICRRLARVLEEDAAEEVRDAAYGALLRLAAAPEETPAP